MRKSNYDKKPIVAIPSTGDACVSGWHAIAERLKAAITPRSRQGTRCVVGVDCYPGGQTAEMLRILTELLSPSLAIAAGEALLSPEKIDTLIEPYLGGDDPVFGRLGNLDLPQFFDAKKVASFRDRINRSPDGLVLIVGCGARHIIEPDILVYADLARWEAQLRFRRGETGNLGANNTADDPGMKYKRAFFVDWRVADRWKRALFKSIDFVLDTHDADNPKLAEGEAIRAGLRHTSTRPFRVVPFYDSAPWGGQWMKSVCDLEHSVKNYGWCFDCVPEENSLLLGFGVQHIELPSLNLVFEHPRSLLGDDIFSRFGAEFPIRFNMLDTMDGGNLSFQVHPQLAYIKEHFGMSYTQDESYYMLDAREGASLYLGLRDDANNTEMAAALQSAQAGGKPFDADRFANRWPAKKHDHFLIPAGTVHCSNTNCMVLEISATPYIFTFKLWDWGRLGLNGKPRPIHLNHGLPNIRWDRPTDWVRKNLLNHITPLASGPGWREEQTGLSKLQFIETRRHWFSKTVPHNTNGTLNVLNLVQGEEAVVESPRGAFDPFVVHYGETFIVPAAVGCYTIRPAGKAARELATIKAFCRKPIEAFPG